MTFPFIQTVIFSTLDITQFYLLSNKLNNKRLIMRFEHFLVILIFGLISAIGSYYTKYAYAYFINSIVLIIFSYIIYKQKYGALIFLFMISHILLLLIQLLVICSIYLFLGDVEYIFKIGIIAQFVGIVLAYMMARYTSIHYLFEYIESGNYIFRIFVLNIFIILSLCVVYWYLRFTAFLASMSFMLAIVTVILLMNLIFLKEGLKNHVIEEQNRAYQLYLPIVNELIDKIRLRQHDFNNHIASLKIAMNQQNVEKDLQVQMYLQKIEKSFNHVNLLKMKRRIIAGFLYSIIKQAEEKSIKLEIVIDDYEMKTSLEDYEILEVLSILVNNAFETNECQNHVKIKFYNENNRSIIKVENKHVYILVSEFNQFFKRGSSTKSSHGRGLGLYKLEKLLSSKKGEIEVSNSGNHENFIVSKVTLPILDK